MVTLAHIFRLHAQEYLERYGSAVLPSHVHAITAIANCRTPAMGGHLAECEECGTYHLLFHSCHHRACPRCGHDAAERWLDHQRDLLLPVPYFHVVFTLPDELRRLVRSHQLVLLAVLFQAAFVALSTLCADPRYLGGRIGALAVLHTWTRTLEWHPHLHLLVPGGALAPDGATWLPLPPRRKLFLVPVRALAKLFRARFLHLARRALPGVDFPNIPWGKRWVVFAKPAVQGPEKVLDYLGRYVFRTAISDKALLACEEHTVTFRYRPNDGGPRKRMTLPAHEFLRRFLQHVPPKGFHRVRAMGLLHPAHRKTLQGLQARLAPQPAASPAASKPERPRRRCLRCGKPSLRFVRRLSARECFELCPLPPSPARAPPLARAVPARRARSVRCPPAPRVLRLRSPSRSSEPWPLDPSLPPAPSSTPSAPWAPSARRGRERPFCRARPPPRRRPRAAPRRTASAAVLDRRTFLPHPWPSPRVKSP